MSMGEEKRNYPRYNDPDLPIRIVIPAISDLELFPRDVSLEGFMVTEIPQRPKVGEVLDCALEIDGQKFDCQVRVVWFMESEAENTTWSVGLSLRKPADIQDEIDSAFERAFQALKA